MQKSAKDLSIKAKVTRDQLFTVRVIRDLLFTARMTRGQSYIRKSKKVRKVVQIRDQ